MPELPEVEAARRRLEKVALGKQIKRSVVTEDDPIVFSGCTHATFATAIEGKTVKSVKRLGKNFYLVLSSSPHVLCHFGMSGMAHVRGEPSPVYRVPRSKSDGQDEWPPKYMKCVIEFVDPSTGRGEGEEGEVTGEWAFCDARRLGRIKLVEAAEGEIEKVEPLSLLGADPFLNMPALDQLSAALGKRNAPIKAVLLDQNGPLCGLGNYMVDEILYQAAIHPSYPSSALSPAQLATLHAQIRTVTVTAVDADADASKFPESWLFHHRWGKGKKKETELVLPDGSTSPIAFETVGGRTSAIVSKVQILPAEFSQRRSKRKDGKRKKVEEEDKEEKMEDASRGGVVDEKAVTSPHFKRSKNTNPVETDATHGNGEEDDAKPAKSMPATKRARSNRKNGTNAGLGEGG
ncbi:hypothetical protein JCM21900_004046 [Sporobolomyces salmonicolor]